MPTSLVGTIGSALNSSDRRAKPQEAPTVHEVGNLVRSTAGIVYTLAPGEMTPARVSEWSGDNESGRDSVRRQVRRAVSRKLSSQGRDIV